MVEEILGIDVNGQDIFNEILVVGNLVEVVFKELNELRKENKKFNIWLDVIFESLKVKKKLFRKRECLLVDFSCFVSVIYNDFFLG